MLVRTASPVSNHVVKSPSPGPLQNPWATHPSSAPRHVGESNGGTDTNGEIGPQDLQDALAANFKDAQQNLANAMERALVLVGRSMASAKRLESEVLNLRVENIKLNSRVDQVRRFQSSSEPTLRHDPVFQSSSEPPLFQSSNGADSIELAGVEEVKLSKSWSRDLKATSVTPVECIAAKKSSPSPTAELPGDVDQPPPPCIAFSVVPSPPEQHLSHLNSEDCDLNQGPVRRSNLRFAEADDKEEVLEDTESGRGENSEHVRFESEALAIEKRGSDSQQSTRSSGIKQFEVLAIWKGKKDKKFSQKLGRYDIGKSRHLKDGALVREGSISKEVRRSLASAMPGDMPLEQYESEVTEEELPKSLAEKVAATKCVAPNSRIRSVWDSASVLFVFYDIVMIPLEFMEPAQSSFINAMRWVTRLFWTLDMFVSFGTGFVASDGNLELALGKVARRYVRTWFLLDFTLVAINWLEVDWSSGSNFLRLRSIQLVRLLRLLRVGSVMIVIAERVRSERLIIFADIIKIIIAILMVAHVMACLWYGIGIDQKDDNSWVQVYNMTSGSLLKRYSLCLHWSLSQFSGGLDEIRPNNIGERVYTILAFLFAFILAAIFVSRLTSSIVRLHMLSNTQAQQLVALRRYLGQNGISHRLATRIQKNAQHAVLEQQCLTPENKVELLKLVSEPLLTELHFELYSPFLCAHPFFGPYMDECPHVMRKVCHLAMSTTQVHIGDIVFNAGEIPLQPKMYLLSNGELIYTAMVSGDIVTVHSGDWMSEMALWTNWMHRGVLIATQNCRLCILDAAKFQDIVGRFEHPAHFNPRAYAEHFVDELNEVEGEITDLMIVSFPLAKLRRKGSVAGHAGDPGGGIKGLLMEAFASGSKNQKFGTRSLSRMFTRNTLKNTRLGKVAKGMTRIFKG